MATTHYPAGSARSTPKDGTSHRSAASRKNHRSQNDRRARPQSPAAELRRALGSSDHKEPKVYFYDTGLVTGSEGARFENAVATMLHAHCLFQADALGKDTELRYIRNKDGNEVDFVLTDRDIPTHFVEAKWQDPKPSRYLIKLAKAFPEADTIQLVRHLRHRHHTAGVWIEPAAAWLAALSNPVPD